MADSHTNNSEARPESPKKKIRPSSTNFIPPPAHILESTDSDSNGLEDRETLENFVAPTRRGRVFEEPSTSEITDTNDRPREDHRSIQEEVVSSSESSAITAASEKSKYCIGNADSLSNDLEDSNQLEADKNETIIRSSEGNTEEK